RLTHQIPKIDYTDYDSKNARFLSINMFSPVACDG
ncbi:unnamed protein product, partial [marine sediment metagenome]